MADNFNDPFAQNLVGLWDFLNGSENNDTGLADGFAQNGHLHGDASVSGDKLHTDGDHDNFDVSGNDDPFDLDVGTIAVQFTQDTHIGSSPDVVVNRGEFNDVNEEGWFAIQVTCDGKVIVQHCPIGPDGTRIDAFLDTPANFFSPGDEIKVTYSWDASTGSTAVIQNLSTGAVFEETSNVVGLTMDIGDNDDENFTFGAREYDDGSYDQFFDGSIDYVAIYDINTINPPASGSDGIVSGTDDNDDINTGYTGDPDGDRIDNNDAILAGEGPQDDIVMAGAGDDKVEAGLGEDEVYGGTGKDELKGQEGNDLLFGEEGDDKLFGGDGNDTLDGGAGNEGYLRGEAGDDVIYGRGGEDKLEGGTGDDFLDGGDDKDELKGEDGDDTLIGGAGPDKIYGGADRDLIIGATDGDEIDGGSSGNDYDTLDLNDAGPVNVVYTSGDKEDGYVELLDQDGNVTGVANFKDIENIVGARNPDGIVDGTDGADVIDINYEDDPHGDRIDSNDAILGDVGSNDDIVDARGGDDIVLAGEEDDTVYAGSGDDTVEGGAGDDLILGDSQLRAGAGDKDGTDLCHVRADHGDINGITLTYEGPSNTVDTDPNAEKFVVGNLLGTDTDGTGFIVVTDKDGTVLFEGDVNEGEQFNFGPSAGDSKFGSQTFISVYDSQGGALLQEINLHTSCSDPLVIGDQFGSVSLSGGAFTDGFECVSTPVQTDDGNDLLLGEEGNDTIFGEGGDDTIDGGTGADLIYGDNNLGGGGASETVRESFEWDLASVANEGTLTGFTQNTGTVDVTFGIIRQTGDSETEFSTDDQNVGDILADGNPVDANSSLDSVAFGAGNQADYSLDFSAPVENVSFRINDVDGDGVVKVTALDAEGNLITVVLDAGDRVTLLDTDSVAGADTADSDGGYLEDTASEYSVLVTIPGPVSEIIIEHDQDGDNNSGINITDVYFDAPVTDTGPDGNDDLNGGLGDDLIFGEGGDDTIDGGEGTDTIDGGAGKDLIIGGAGDVVDGGAGGFDANPALNTDFDTLDLTGQGPFYLDNVTPDSNGNGINGTVVFVDGAGNPTGQTLTFVEIEDVIGDEVNRGPDAVNDNATTAEDTSVVINVIGNDTDPDGDTLTVTAVSVPADQGTVADNGDGTITFTPAPDFNGDATITYTITDGNGGSDTATVTVDVTPVNDDPVAFDDTASTDEDTSVVVDLIGNDTDVDGDPLTLGAVSVPEDQGTVVDNGDGTVTFTPAPEFNGEATITYTVEDGQGGSDEGEAVVTVNAVNDGPDAVNDSDTTQEDTAVTVDLLANDTDPEGDPLTVTGATVPADQGTLVDNGDGTVTFTPAPDFNGTATISYSISDGNGGTDTAIHEIEVTPVNDDPVAVDDAADTLEDEAVVVDLIGNDTDVDGDPLTIGTVSVPADQGTVVDNGDGTVTFTPAPDYNGPATITYTVVDGQGGTDEGQAVVNVGSVNDGPDAVDDSDTTDEDTPITVDLLANDSDPEGDALTVTGASVPAAQGTLVDNGDGTVTFTPAPDFNGTATISYSITDGNGGTDAAEHVITVTPVNDDPVAVDDNETTDEDQPITIDLIANDTDVDGDPLTIGTVSVPADQGTVVDNGDGTVTFTPAQDFNGPATITYTVVDGQGGSDEGEAVVSVGAVNDGPVANDDSDTTEEDTPITVDLTGNDTDADGDTLTVLTATVPADQGTVVNNGDGTVTFTPAPDFNGTATINYEISDGNGGTDTATHNVEVTPVNDDPVAVDDADTTPFNTAVTVDVIGNDTDVDGDPLTIGTVSVPASQGDVVDNGDGTVTFTPADGFEGPATITYTVVDGQGGSDEGELVVTVEEQPLDGIVSGTGDGELIDEDYTGDPEGDMVDNGDNIFSNDPEDADDDIIEAGGGNDTVVAGAGDDSVDGGEGNDEITAGEGSDTVEGGAGDDNIDTGNGSFLIDKGYPGLFPGEEGTPGAEDDRDFVDGGDGNDTIRTGDDRDTIVGGTGDDVIDGGIDDDEITGDDGADRIVGGEGSDDIEGGIGNDTIYAGNDPVLGLDNLNIEDDGSNPFGPDLRPDNGRDTVSGGEGDDVIFGADDDDLLFGDEGNDYIDGEIDDDTIDGGIGDDTLLGGQGKDSILGGDGNDSINAGRNADFVDGGDGNDTIFGENGADVLNGGAGDDLIDGGTGDDTLNGDGGNDRIFGSTGDDVIDGGTGDDTIDGGNGGADIMSGGDDRDTFINVDAGEVVDGGEGVTESEDFDTLDLTGSAPANGSLEVVYEAGNPENGVVNYFDQDGNDAGQLTFTNIENVIPCFTPGTLIATPKGERRVEDLAVGDRIITRDNGIQEIRWMGAKDMKASDFAKAQHLRPVMIRKGALGGGLPERDMMVSPNHRVLVANDKTALYFEEREVLVAAKFLTGLDGVDVVDVAWTTYIHIMFDQHEVVLSDGAWTESFQPGDQTLAGVGNAQRNEIFELFPELKTRVGINSYTSARKTLKKHEAHLLTK